MRITILIGLVLNMAGTLLVWRFGLPAKEINREGAIGLAILKGDPAMIVLSKRYDRAASAGMLLIFVGFVLQAIGLFNLNSAVER